MFTIFNQYGKYFFTALKTKLNSKAYYFRDRFDDFSTINRGKMLRTLQIVGTFLFIAILLEIYLIGKQLDQDE